MPSSGDEYIAGALMEHSTGQKARETKQHRRFAAGKNCGRHPVPSRNHDSDSLAILRHISEELEPELELKES